MYGMGRGWHIQNTCQVQQLVFGFLYSLCSSDVPRYMASYLEVYPIFLVLTNSTWKTRKSKTQAFGEGYQTVHTFDRIISQLWLWLWPPLHSQASQSGFRTTFFHFSAILLLIIWSSWTSHFITSLHDCSSNDDAVCFLCLI